MTPECAEAYRYEDCILCGRCAVAGEMVYHRVVDGYTCQGGCP